MPKALRDLGAAFTFLQLLLLLTSVEPRPQGWDQEKFRLESIKKEILERLGLSAPPVLRTPLDTQSIRRAQRLYRQKVAELTANRSREAEPGTQPGIKRRHRLTPTLLHQLDVPQGHQNPQGHQDLRGPHHYHLLLSRTESFHRQLQVIRAELKLFQQSLMSPDVTPPDTSVAPRVSIYTRGEVGGTPQLLQSQELAGPAPSLDITGAIQAWATSPEDTLHLELAFTTHVPAFLATLENETLALEVETYENVGRGSRRGRGSRKTRGLEEECGKSDGKCCLKTLKVSFQDIGWSDWIIAPNSYSMRFCQGSCPHNYKAATMHAQIQARVHALSKATPPPCCVPAAYDPMVLMHYDGEGRLVSTLFEDMLVTSCHCA
ncbi:growth/differentiation factor 15 [Calypte anna]|uniref:growth/differentiation factor 15 n=1 Tax=Calypte anna TaxID=9244 RepID=UPI0004BEEABD|nr:growth/differentiation factor 15 [Calypte anna]